MKIKYYFYIKFHKLNIQIYKENEIKCSPSGKYISVFNRSNGYFEILAINNQHI